MHKAARRILRHFPGDRLTQLISELTSHLTRREGSVKPIGMTLIPAESGLDCTRELV